MRARFTRQAKMMAPAFTMPEGFEVVEKDRSFTDLCNTRLQTSSFTFRGREDVRTYLR